MTKSDLELVFLQAENRKAECVMIELEDGSIKTFKEHNPFDHSFVGQRMRMKLFECDGKLYYGAYAIVDVAF